MGAGAPQATINAWIRRQIKKQFAAYGGERIEGKAAATRAEGVYNGAKWTLSYNVLRASNGEVFTLAVIHVNGILVPMHTSLEAALAPYKETK